MPKNKKLYQLIAVEPMMTLSMEESSRLSAAYQSRLFMVMATVEKGALVDNSVVQEALKSHWKQISGNILTGCEPIGAAKVEYNKKTQMYTATAKVGIRGDIYQQMLQKAASFKPNNLSGKDLDQFIETNQTIIDAAK